MNKRAMRAGHFWCKWGRNFVQNVDLRYWFLMIVYWYYNLCHYNISFMYALCINSATINKRVQCWTKLLQTVYFDCLYFSAETVHPISDTYIRTSGGKDCAQHLYWLHRGERDNQDLSSICTSQPHRTVSMDTSDNMQIASYTPSIT